MKKIILLLLIISFGFLGNSEFALAQENSIEINFFYSTACPHCKSEDEFLKELAPKYPDVKFNKYEVTGSKENQELLKTLYEKYEVPEREQGYVPVIFTPNKYFIGFSEQIAKDIEICLKDCLIGGETALAQIVKIPILGEINISKMSLPALTITLGALDGFNPCAMWILLFLITLLLNVRSRKRMYLIGGTFILASGVVYYLILAAWLKLFLAISYVNLTRILIGVFALGLGVWQIKNFINYRPGTCKVTDGKQGFQAKIKNGLKNHAEKLVLSPLNLGIIGGIILLALGVNLVEFFCSAGLPAIYTRILSLNNVSNLNYHLYLLLYTFVFMLDDLIIFSLAFFTLSKLGFTEKYNYWATLVGGLLTLVLGILLIFKPELLMFT
jgi:glutaredoxin